MSPVLIRPSSRTGQDGRCWYAWQVFGSEGLVVDVAICHPSDMAPAEPPAEVPAEEAPERPRKTNRRTRWIVGVGAIVALGIAVVVVALARSNDENVTSEEEDGGHADDDADQSAYPPPVAVADRALRLTKDVRQALLDRNEGFKTSTSFRNDNFRETRRYVIRDGQVLVHAVGKAALSDRHDEEFVADEASSHRFLKKNLHALNTEGLG